MSEHNTYSGTAALSNCESLLLALNDAQVLPESEIMDVLKDAAAAHDNAIGTELDPLAPIAHCRTATSVDEPA